MDTDLHKENTQLKLIVLNLERQVEFLRRENNRRKTEINSIISALRKS